MNDKVLFLDFDGVICVWDKVKRDSFFVEEKMSLIEKFCLDNDVKIVISSDWRYIDESAIEDNLSAGLISLLHLDPYTPVTGHRWNEIQRWLKEHPEVGQFVIIDDFEGHFEGCPPEIRERLVICPSKEGVSIRHFYELEEKLNHTDNVL